MISWGQRYLYCLSFFYFGVLKHLQSCLITQNNFDSQSLINVWVTFLSPSMNPSPLVYFTIKSFDNVRVCFMGWAVVWLMNSLWIAQISKNCFSVVGINYNFLSLQAAVGFAALFITWGSLTEEMQKTTDRKLLSHWKFLQLVGGQRDFHLIKKAQKKKRSLINKQTKTTISL